MFVMSLRAHDRAGIPKRGSDLVVRLETGTEVAGAREPSLRADALLAYTRHIPPRDERGVCRGTYRCGLRARIEHPGERRKQAGDNARDQHTPAVK